MLPRADAATLRPAAMRACDQSASPGDSVRPQLQVPVEERQELKKRMAAYGNPQGRGLAGWQRRKSGRMAALANMALPGLGQLYNGRRYKTMIMVGVDIWFLGNIMYDNRRKERFRKERDAFPVNSLEWKQKDLFFRFHRENVRDFLWFSGAAYLLSTIDAFIDAHLFDVRSVDPTVIQGASKEKYMGLSVSF